MATRESSPGPEIGPMARPRLRWVVFTVVFAVTMGAILTLWSDVLQQQDRLNRARSDNVQWTVGQALVEYQDMMAALHHAQTHEPGSAAALDALRIRFDVLYSRMHTLATAPLYAHLLEDPSYSAAFQRIRDGLEAAIPLIDGSDAELRSALPELSERFADFEDDIRSFGLQAVVVFANRSDALRDSLSRTMDRFAMVTAAMIGTLVILTLVLFREGRAGEMQLQRLKRTAARLDTILNTSLDAIVVTHLDGRISDFNLAAQRLFGVTEPRARDHNLADFLVPEGSWGAGGWSLRRMIGLGIVEMKARDSDGRLLPIELNVEEVRLGDGALLVAFIRDIGMRKQAENELISARDDALAGDRAKAEFVAVMSHELRTPLNGILGMLRLLKGTSITIEQQDYVAKMEMSGNVLLSLVNDVLDLSRAEVGRVDLNPRPVALDPLLRSIAESLSGAAAARGNGIAYQAIGPLPERLLLDPMRLQQVLGNLLGNAIKFTSAGQITLEAEILMDAGGAEVLELRVADTGIGMNESELPRIFDDFEVLDRSFAREQTGAGLGLAIVRRIVDAMGGQVFVESEPGEGSLFIVTLPVHKADEVPADDDASPRDEPHENAAAFRVLVVEDNDINRAVLCGLLQRRQCQVEEASNGRDGVRMAAEFAFDLILMDVSMPEIDGIEAARRIRRAGGASSSAPIVAVTAHAAERQVAAIRQEGFAGVLTKPVEASMLASLLDGKGLDDPVPAAMARGGPPPLLDDAHLDCLCRELGAPSLLRLLERFIAEAEVETRRIANAFGTAGVSDDLAFQAHRLAGAAANFGAKRLAERLHRIEEAAQRDNTGALAAQLPGLRPDWAGTRMSLRRWTSKFEDGAADQTA